MGWLARAGISLTAVALVLGTAVPMASALPGDGASPTATATATPTPTPTPTPSTPDPTPTPTDPTPSEPPDGPVEEPGRQDTLRLPMHKGDTGDYVGVLHERLSWMGYDIAKAEVRQMRFGPTTKPAVRALQTKFFLFPTGQVNKRTWSLLKGLAEPVGWVPKPCRKGTVLCIDKTQKVLRFMRGREVLLALDARFGTPSMPTREGVFHVFAKSRDHWSSAYGTWMPFALFFSGGQAVHYSPYFDRDGYFGGSHGCVGVRDIKAAEWLFDRVPVGTRVVVYRS